MDMIDFHPKILPAGYECELSARLTPEIRMAGVPCVRVLPMEGMSGEAIDVPSDGVAVDSGNIRIRLSLLEEQEYQVELYSGRGADESRRLAVGCVYAVNADLAVLRPLKGDFHMHSVRSDGKDLPAEVAVACRRIGLDFMAVTDHRLYAPSLEALRVFTGSGLGLVIFPGEEIHPPGNPVHMINFGGRESVNEQFANQSYSSEVAEMAAGLHGFTSEVSRGQYASCLWCYDKIREIGGLGIFCHPYWVTGGRYNVCEELILRHFRDRPFDAYEVLGGFDINEYASNTLQAARYHEERIRNPGLPVVGVSDAHGSNTGSLFGWYYTIVFAASSGLEDIISAVKELRSVAVAMLPGRPPEVIGPFRLVKLALFLMREYMPEHDRLCVEDAEAMRRYMDGDKDASACLRESCRKLEDYHKSTWSQEQACICQPIEGC